MTLNARSSKELQEFRSALDEQYDLLFRSLSDGSTTHDVS